MKIKQVEELVGITSKNIRFYENQGLLTPERAENGYREYHQKNIDELKKIKLFRKLGISVEEIKAVLGGNKKLGDCLDRHVDVLNKERENLDNMQKLSMAILQSNADVDNLNTDEWLDEMEKHEDVAVRGGVKLAKEYIQHLKDENKRLDSENNLKNEYLKKVVKK